MHESETIAQDLASKLRAAGFDANVVGGGVHWRVEARAGLERTLVVHCFWYERAVHELMLGMNPANACTSEPLRQVMFRRLDLVRRCYRSGYRSIQ